MPEPGEDRPPLTGPPVTTGALAKELNRLGRPDRKDRAHHRIDRRRGPIGRPPAWQSWSARPGTWPRCGERRRDCVRDRARGGTATFLRADLASLAEVRRLADAVQDTTDRLDILINNAGIGTAGGVRLSKSRAVSDRLKSFGCATGHPRQSASQRQECLILAPSLLSGQPHGSALCEARG